MGLDAERVFRIHGRGDANLTRAKHGSSRSRECAPPVPRSAATRRRRRGSRVCEQGDPPRPVASGEEEHETCVGARRRGGTDADARNLLHAAGGRGARGAGVCEGAIAGRVRVAPGRRGLGGGRAALDVLAPCARQEERDGPVDEHGQALQARVVLVVESRGRVVPGRLESTQIRGRNDDVGHGRGVTGHGVWSQGIGEHVIRRQAERIGHAFRRVCENLGGRQRVRDHKGVIQSFLEADLYHGL